MEQIQGLLNQLTTKNKEIRIQKENVIRQKLKKTQNANQNIIQLIRLEKQFSIIQQILSKQIKDLQQNIRLLLIIKHLLPEHIANIINTKAQQYNVENNSTHLLYTHQEIQQRKSKFFLIIQNQQNDNESDWTDGTSVANTDQDFDQILVVNDDIALAMEQSQGSQQQMEQQSNQIKQEEQKIEQLQQQFVVNGKSDHLKLFKGHDKFVVSLLVDSISDKLVSGGGDDKLNIYNLKDLNNQQVLQFNPEKTFTQQQTISILKLNYNSQLLLAVTQKYISVYNSKSLEYKKIQIQNCVSLGIHPLGNVCLISSGHQIHLYNLNNCSLYNTYYLDKQTTLAEFTPNGKFFVAGSKGQLKVIQPKKQQTKKISGHNFHQEQVVCIDFKQNICLTGGVDGYACLSNWLNGNALVRTQLHPNSVQNVTFYNNMFLTACVDGTLRWYDTNTMKKISNHKFESAITRMIKWKAAQRIAVSTFNGEICVIDPRSPLQNKVLFNAGSTIHELVSYKQYGLMAGCEDGLVKYFDIRKL